MKARYYFFTILSVAAALAGCAPNSLTPPAGGESLRGVIDSDLAATKAILLDNPGVKLESFWVAGDQIGVFGGSAANVAFQVAAEDLSADARTAEFRADASIPNGTLTAYSPYQAGAAGDGDGIVINFPDKQQLVTVNGIVQPDPAAHILYGTGSRGGGLVFRSMIAVLKIGQAFETETLVKSVEFRDLSGAPVAGAMKLSGAGAEITGSTQVLTLDLGDGLAFPAGSIRPLFLIVPARAYPQGFEITFVDDKGVRTVRTVGSAMGKTLERSVVYLVGDISGENYDAQATAVLKPEATLMTPEVLDKVQLVDVHHVQLLDPDGNPCYDQDYVPLYMPRLGLLVHKDLDPQVGHMLVFNQPTDDLPGGGVYRITQSTPVGDFYDVVASPEVNFAAAYENLQIGTPLFDDAGNLLEDGGVEIDLASHVVSIVDVETDSTIPFDATKGGVIQFGEDAMATLFGLPETKVTRKNYAFPNLSLKHSGDNAECSLGAELTLKTKFAVGSIQGELQYVHLTVEPEFKLSAEFVLMGGFQVGKKAHLIKLLTTPIVIGPLVLTPSVDISCEIGLGGEVKFSTSVSYVYNAGMFGLSYNRGDGFTARHQTVPVEPAEITPEVGGMSASLYAYATLNADPYLSIYGLFGMGVQTGFSLKFGATYEEKTQSMKLALEPELEMVPSFASLGGYFTHTFTDLTTNVAFDPLWERYLFPKVIMAGSGYQSLPTSEKFYDFDVNGVKVSAQVPVSPKTWTYHVELEEPTAIKYEVQARVMESNGRISRRDQFTYVPYPEELCEGEYYEDFEACFAAGNPYLYWGEWGVSNPDAGSMSSPRLVHTETIGTYPSSDAPDFKGQIFDGAFNAEVSSHHLFWTEVWLVPVGGGPGTVIGRGRDRVYFWPEDVQGRAYTESAAEE